MMNSRIQIRVVLALTVGLALLPVAAATPPIAQAEIDYLLDFIGKSGCEFYRNGAWYPSDTAQAHLRSKYEKVTARSAIDTAEDFITKVATKSSISGRPYKARCNGGAVMTSSQWLTDALTRHRAESAALHT